MTPVKMSPPGGTSPELTRRTLRHAIPSPSHESTSPLCTLIQRLQTCKINLVTTSGSFQPITPRSIRFNTAAACSDSVRVISGSPPPVSFPQLSTGLRGAARLLFGVKDLTTKSFGTMRHSATQVICTSSESKCWP